MKTRIFFSLIITALFTVVFIPTSIASDEIHPFNSAIKFTLPGADWAIEFPNIDNDYRVYAYSSTVGIQWQLAKIINVEDMYAHHKFSDHWNVNAFAIRDELATTPDACLNNFFTGDSTFNKYGVWKELPNENNQSVWRFAFREEKPEDKDNQQEYQYSAITSLYDGCIGLTISAYNDEDHSHKLAQHFLSAIKFITNYKQTIDDYVQFGNTYEDTSYYYKALDMVDKLDYQSNFEFRTALVYKIIDRHFRSKEIEKAIIALTEIQNIKEDDYILYFGVGLAYHLNGDHEAGESYLRSAFEKQLNLESFPSEDNPLSVVYSRFKYNLFKQFNKDHYWLQDEMWNEWIEQYDFSVEAASEWLPYIDKLNKKIEKKPGYENINTKFFDSMGEFNGKYAIVHEETRDNDHGWHLIDKFGNTSSQDYAKIINYNDEILLASDTTFGNGTFYHFDGSLAFTNPLIKNGEWFNNGIAAVEDDNGQWFHIDANGKPIYSDRYSYVGTLNKGIAVAKNENEKYFHIDNNGKRLYSSDFDFANNFNLGAATVKKDNKWFHINIKGQPLYSQKFDYAEDFKLGVARVSLNDKTFYINKNGESIYDAKNMGNLSNGAIAVVADNNDMYHIDRKGNRLYQGSYSYVSDYITSRAYVTDFDGKSYIIDKKGVRTHRINPKTGTSIKIARASQPLYEFYEWVSSPINGISSVMDKEGKWFHVYQNGDKLYQQNYKWADDFNGKLAKVLDSDNKWKFIDIKGNDIMSESYINIGQFIGGIALVSDDKGGLFYINNNGKKLNKTPFIYATNFSEGRAVVEDEKGNIYHINTAGNRIYNQNYISISPYHDGKAIARDSQSNWFYLDINGQIIENENPLNSLSIETLQGIGPGMMPCPEVLFGFINPNDPYCEIMQKDLENSITR